MPGKKKQQEPVAQYSYQPLNKMDEIYTMICDDMEAFNAAYRFYSQRLRLPTVHDFEMLNQAKAVYTEAVETLPIYTEQLDVWEKTKLTVRQKKCIKEMKGMTDQLVELAPKILEQIRQRRSEYKDITVVQSAEEALRALDGTFFSDHDSDVAPDWDDDDDFDGEDFDDELPQLIISDEFMTDFVASEGPCGAVGILVEDPDEYPKRIPFIIFNPARELDLPPSDQGLDMGMEWCTTGKAPVIKITFRSPGYKDFMLLLNPNTKMVRTVFSAMLEYSYMYCFCVIGNSSVKMFQPSVYQYNPWLIEHVPKMKKARTTGKQYEQIVADECKDRFKAIKLMWVCRSKAGYLDPESNPLDLTPRGHSMMPQDYDDFEDEDEDADLLEEMGEPLDDLVERATHQCQPTSAFQLPHGMSCRRENPCNGVYTYTISHEDHGDIGRILVQKDPRGHDQVSCELAGHPDDQQTKVREELFAPVAKDIMALFQTELDPVDEPLTPLQPPSTGREKVEMRLFYCEVCEEPVALLIFSNLAETPQQLRTFAQNAYAEYSERELDTWVIGVPIDEETDPERPRGHMMKVWPEQGKPELITLDEIYDQIEVLERTHCASQSH